MSKIIQFLLEADSNSIARVEVGTVSFVVIQDVGASMKSFSIVNSRAQQIA